MFLLRTVQDVLKAIRGDTEIIVVLDGYWPDEPFPQNERLTIIQRPKSIGQRAATNEAARVSTAPYIMKLDAHCSMDEGFDVKLLESAKELGDDVLQVPAQWNLHAFDWVCKCGHRQDQGPSGPCPACKAPKAERKREVVWTKRRKTTSWYFDTNLKFEYWGTFTLRPEGKKEISETMSLLGACWFTNREHYWKLDGLDESHGGWGQMGTELACKWWLSGGRVVCNKRTWFAHMFRTQGGDFSFPYPLKHHHTEKARKYSQDLWRRDVPDEMPKWDGAIRPLRWLLDHFKPVKGWHDGSVAETEGKVQVEVPSATEASSVAAAPVSENPGRTLTRGIVYYSDCRPDPTILEASRRQLLKAVNGFPIASVTLAPVDFGDIRVVLKRARGIETMFRQILLGLEELDTDVAFLCEHDLLYHPTHFEFTPPKPDVYYYNENVWKVRAEDGQALFYYTKQTSGLCANRKLLVEHYHKRIAKVVQNQRDIQTQGLPIKRDGFSQHMGFEPGCHAEPRGVDNYRAEAWMSEYPNIDIRHSRNLTPNRWSQDQFRSKRSCQGWTMADEVPGWGRTKGRFAEILREV
jgi:hypothetical protein